MYKIINIYTREVMKAKDEAALLRFRSICQDSEVYNADGIRVARGFKYTKRAPKALALLIDQQKRTFENELKQRLIAKQFYPY